MGCNDRTTPGPSLQEHPKELNNFSIMGFHRNIQYTATLILISLVIAHPLPAQSQLDHNDGKGLLRFSRGFHPFYVSWNEKYFARSEKSGEFSPVSEVATEPELTGFMTTVATTEKKNGTDIKDIAKIPEEGDGSAKGEKNATTEDQTSRSTATSEKLRKESIPFSSSIGNQSIYGGLITYSHDLHPARICRVMNACVRLDGTLVLPEWMKRLDSSLSFHCGHSKLEFSLPDTSPPPSLKPFDLVGLHLLRPSMPDFIRDFTPNAIVFDLVFGDRKITKSCHSRTGKDCKLFPDFVQDFRPSVFLHSRLKEMDEKESWVRQFIKLMKSPDSGRHANIEYRKEVGGVELQCYRSAFFTRGPYNKNLIAQDHLRNIHFLQLNRIRKKAKRVSRKMAVNGKEQKVCDLNITITNRKLVDGARDRLISRYIVNIPELRKAIENQAKRIPGLRVKIASMTLEGKSLWWQINAMQKTDIWIAGRGSLLTNMLFMRENSTVMEIQPFTYYPREFENMAKHLAYVHYDRYIAHPDLEGFKACMLHLYPKKHSLHQNALELLEKFSNAAAKYAQSDSTHSFVLHNFKNTSLHHLKTCAQMQRLDTNAKNLAVTIVRHARLRCGFPKPNSTSASRLETTRRTNSDYKKVSKQKLKKRSQMRSRRSKPSSSKSSRSL